MEDIKSNINKWKDSHVHRSGNNIVKMAIVLHIQHNAYQKYSLFFLAEIYKLPQEIHVEIKLR